MALQWFFFILLFNHIHSVVPVVVGGLVGAFAGLELHQTVRQRRCLEGELFRLDGLALLDSLSLGRRTGSRAAVQHMTDADDISETEQIEGETVPIPEENTSSCWKPEARKSWYCRRRQRNPRLLLTIRSMSITGIITTINPNPGSKNISCRGFKTAVYYNFYFAKKIFNFLLTTE